MVLITLASVNKFVTVAISVFSNSSVHIYLKLGSELRAARWMPSLSNQSQSSAW
jgi:hypothetical protein